MLPCRRLDIYQLILSHHLRYSSSLACARDLVAREGARAFFKGAGVNGVRGGGGAGVLSGSDRLKKIYITRREEYMKM